VLLLLQQVLLLPAARVPRSLCQAALLPRSHCSNQQQQEQKESWHLSRSCSLQQLMKLQLLRENVVHPQQQVEATAKQQQQQQQQRMGTQQGTR
jgi:hypothetical protein